MADLNRIRELLLAAAEGDLETLSQVDPELLDVCNDEGNTLLMSSCANGKEAVVRHLLNPKFNVKIDAANVYGWTALMQACYYGHTAVVGVLLDKGADINLMNSWGATPLLAATQSGNMTLVKMLIQHKASVTPCDKSPTQFTPLMAAAQNGHEGITAVLLNNSADPNVQLAGSKYTALMFATLNGHMSLVRLLLKHGADKEMESSSSQKSVAIAGAIGREDIARLLGYSRDTDSSSSLIQNNLVPDGGVDIFTAVQTGDRMLRTVQRMVGASPDLVNAKDGHGATPLMYASMKGSVQVCRFLLEHGADVNCQDSVCEWTAFMQAVHHGQYVVAKLLIDYKADINLKAKEGCSAAEIATCNGDMKMLQLIMKYSKVPVLKETGTEDGTRGQGNNTHESLHHWMAQMNERLGNIPMKDHLLLRPDIVQITPRTSPVGSPRSSPGPSSPYSPLSPTHTSPTHGSSPASSAGAINPLETIHEEDDSSHRTTFVTHPVTRPVPPSFSISPSPQVILERVSNAFKEPSADQVTELPSQKHTTSNIDRAFDLPVKSTEKMVDRFPTKRLNIKSVGTRKDLPTTPPTATPTTPPIATFTATPTDISTSVSKSDATCRDFPSAATGSVVLTMQEGTYAIATPTATPTATVPNASQVSTPSTSLILSLSKDTPVSPQHGMTTSLQSNQDTPTPLQSNQDTPTPLQSNRDMPTVFHFSTKPSQQLNDTGCHGDNSSVGDFLSELVGVRESTSVASPDKTKKAFRKRVDTNFSQLPDCVEDVLKVLELEMYSSVIEENEIDLETFLTMSDEDLEDIGINDASHRLKLINAILKLNRSINLAAKSDRLVYHSSPRPSSGFVFL